MSRNCTLISFRRRNLRNLLRELIQWTSYFNYKFYFSEEIACKILFFLNQIILDRDAGKFKVGRVGTGDALIHAAVKASYFGVNGSLAQIRRSSVFRRLDVSYLSLSNLIKVIMMI